MTQLKDAVNSHIGSAILYYDKSAALEQVGYFFSFFSDLIKVTNSFILNTDQMEYFIPKIYLIRNDTSSRTIRDDDMISHMINTSICISFIYFALKEILKDSSFKHDMGYIIALNERCIRHYTKSDLLLCFNYIDEDNGFIEKTLSKNTTCMDINDINPKFINIFDQNIEDYEKILTQLINENSSTFHLYTKDLFDLSCEIFAVSDYNADLLFSEESFVLAYEICMNLGILADSISQIS